MVHSSKAVRPIFMTDLEPLWALVTVKESHLRWSEH